MRPLYLFLFLLPAFTFAQTTHNVQVGGSTAGGALPFYSPQELTIDVGDIVIWTNTNGTHNVNGTLVLYPANPEGFSSGNAASGNWTFQHTFTIPGTYEYRCTQQGHGATQNGTITVVNTSSVNENDGAHAISLFPSPTADVLTVDLGAQDIRLAEVIGLDGRAIRSIPVNGNARLEISTNGMVSGQYFLRLTDAHGRYITRTFRKD